MRREISVYQLGNRILILGKKRTIKGLPILAEPIYDLDYSNTTIEIGNIIRACVESFSEGNEHPSREDLKNVNAPLIKLANQKNAKAFFTKVKCVPIVELNGIISFHSTENHGWKEGFKFTVHPNIDLDYTKATDEELGKALIQSLEWSSIV